LTNCNTLSSVSGSPLNLTAGASTVNIASAVNMVDTLTINNNTVHNGLVVSDGLGDTSCFVIDQSGNVGVKVNPSSSMTSDFVVNGNSSLSGNLSVGGTLSASNLVNNITAGAGLVKTGTSSNPILTNTGVTSAVAGSGVSVSSGTGAVTISNSGVLGVSAGSSGISVSGTAQNPVINNTGVTQLTAGSNITLSGSTGNITISASSSPSTPQVKLSRLGISPSSSGPVSGGTTGYQGLSFLTGAFYNDIIAGSSPDPNGVWVLDFSPLCLLLTGSINTGFVQIGLGDSIDPNIYYNSGSNVAQFGSLPATNALVPRTGSCPPFIVKVSDLVATCPNINSPLTRLYFNNQSTDTMQVQTLPVAVNCYYYPNGVQ
jgi:hypothetical protein